MKPPLVSEGLIRVPYGWITENLQLTGPQERILAGKLVSESICPRNYYFEDCPEVRRVLKLEEQ